MRRSSPSFTLEIPPEWEDRSILTFVGPIEDGFRSSLMVAREPAGHVSIEDYADEQERTLMKQLSRPHKRARREHAIAGHPAVMIEVSFHAKGVGDITQLVAFIGVGEEIVTASATSSSKSFSTSRAQYERMIESLAVS